MSLKVKTELLDINVISSNSVDSDRTGIIITFLSD